MYDQQSNQVDSQVGAERDQPWGASDSEKNKNNNKELPLEAGPSSPDHLTNLKFEPLELKPLERPAVTNNDEFIVRLPSEEQTKSTMETFTRSTQTVAPSTTLSPLKSSPVQKEVLVVTQRVTHKSAKAEQFEPGVQCLNYKCLSPFVTMVVLDNPPICTCDCPSDSQEECHKIKRGIIKLSHKENRLIVEKKFNSPRCKFGTYDTINRRCPKKSSNENLNHIHNVPHERD